MNYKTFYHLNSHKIFFYLFILAFLCQIFFWKKTEKIIAPFDLVPPAPTKYLTSALSLGDQEFLFRLLATRLQNSGDVFAGFVALKNYDYSRIYDWMTALDRLNAKSSFVPALASYYYAQTQKHEDNKYIVKYLDEHSSKNIDDDWWWMMQAALIAKSSLKDLNLAASLAEKISLSNNPNIPFLAKNMPAFIRAQLGDHCLLFHLIEGLIKENKNQNREISSEELNLTRFFIAKRLDELKKAKFNPAKCH